RVPPIDDRRGRRSARLLVKRAGGNHYHARAGAAFLATDFRRLGPPARQGYLGFTGPISVSGSQVAMSGNTQRMTIARNMQSTYGIVPHITRVTGTSGAIACTM